jgi:hypothetical protein
MHEFAMFVSQVNQTFPWSCFTTASSVGAKKKSMFSLSSSSSSHHDTKVYKEKDVKIITAIGTHWFLCVAIWLVVKPFVTLLNALCVYNLYWLCGFRDVILCSNRLLPRPRDYGPDSVGQRHRASHQTSESELVPKSVVYAVWLNLLWWCVDVIYRFLM